MILSGYKIFYIEDDLKNRALTQMILEQAGAKVGFERWGREETIPKLRQFGDVDLILLDLMFPRGVTGYDIFKAIRECSEFDKVPIVAISASDPAVEIPRTRALGFAGFIGKPINLRIFPKQIASFINGEKLWIASA